MHPKIQVWENQLKRITQDFNSECGALQIAELNWKPAPKVWSVGQILHHLITINTTYFPIIDQLHTGKYEKPFMARFPFLVNFFGNFVLKGVEPQQKRKTKTFPIWEPAQSEIPENILQDFEKHQQELIALIRSCDDLLAKNTVISSPANRIIVYRLEKAFDIITTHEERHLLQAKEINNKRKSFINSK